MNRTTKFLAPASLAISAYCPKVYLQAIPHRNLNVAAKASLLSTKSSFDSCPKHSFMEKFDCKLSTDLSDTTSMSDKDELSFALQKLVVNEGVDENVNNLDINLNTNSESKESLKKKQLIEKNKYIELRRWKRIGKEKTTTSGESFILKVLSFNILAQDLLEAHAYLYRDHNRQALPWEKRKPLLVQEILDAEAQVVCLQEMQEEHLRDFLIPFQENGYTYLYKKRTNDKKDGLLLLYKEDILNLIEFSKIELYQNGIELLNRDNVGLVAKFSVKESPETKFVVATTHLLYNPRRNDVRLGQVQLLFAEIERIAFIKNTSLGPQYLPIVLSGDFNLQPYSGVYRFITEGSIEFVGKGRNLEQCDYHCLSNSLIPPHLHITDECQHFNVLSQRLKGTGSGKVMLRNSENFLQKDDQISDSDKSSLVNSRTTSYQKVEIADGHFVTFSSGLLTHPFQFKSVYNHTNKKGKTEATTFQNRWITVDYIFYTDMKPLRKYKLPTADECTSLLSTIPNLVVGSDHLCLGAIFELKKR